MATELGLTQRIGSRAILRCERLAKAQRQAFAQG
jgi:hypothetical protein